MHPLADVIACKPGSWLTTATSECVAYMDAMPEQSVDVVLGSPPYSDKRPYNGAATILTGREWVCWMTQVFKSCLRVSRGPVLMVVDGSVEDGCFDCTPQLLVASLHTTGIKQQRPVIYRRFGVPGKARWFRNLYENVIVAFNSPDFYFDPTAMGRAPVCGPGGPTSNRGKDGERSNKERRAYKQPERTVAGNAVDALYTLEEARVMLGLPRATDADLIPGDEVDCGAVGGGNIGSKSAHLSQAPFPEYLVEYLVKSLTKPGDIVLDPFVGSGTSAKVALMLGRRAVAVDVDHQMVGLTERRCSSYIPSED